MRVTVLMQSVASGRGSISSVTVLTPSVASSLDAIIELRRFQDGSGSFPFGGVRVGFRGVVIAPLRSSVVEITSSTQARFVGLKLRVRMAANPSHWAIVSSRVDEAVGVQSYSVTQAAARSD